MDVCNIRRTSPVCWVQGTLGVATGTPHRQWPELRPCLAIMVTWSKHCFWSWTLLYASALSIGSMSSYPGTGREPLFASWDRLFNLNSLATWLDGIVAKWFIELDSALLTPASHIPFVYAFFIALQRYCWAASQSFLYFQTLHIASLLTSCRLLGTSGMMCMVYRR